MRYNYTNALTPCRWLQFADDTALNNNNNNNNNNNRFISSSILLHGSSPRNLYVVYMLDVFTNVFFFFSINIYKVRAMALSIR